MTFVPVTNPLAYAKRERAGDRNLNRNLRPDGDSRRTSRTTSPTGSARCSRSHEVLLDLHSTRAKTEAFAMLGPRDNDGRHRALQALRRRSASWRAASACAASSRAGSIPMRAAWRGARTKGSAANPLTTDRALRRRHHRVHALASAATRSRSSAASTTTRTRPRSPTARSATRSHSSGITDEPAPPPVESYEALRMHEVIDRDARRTTASAAHVGELRSRSRPAT